MTEEQIAYTRKGEKCLLSSTLPNGEYVIQFYKTYESCDEEVYEELSDEKVIIKEIFKSPPTIEIDKKIKNKKEEFKRISDLISNTEKEEREIKRKITLYEKKYSELTTNVARGVIIADDLSKNSVFINRYGKFISACHVTIGRFKIDTVGDGTIYFRKTDNHESIEVFKKEDVGNVSKFLAKTIEVADRPFGETDSYYMATWASIPEEYKTKELCSLQKRLTKKASNARKSCLIKSIKDYEKEIKKAKDSLKKL